MTRPAGDAPAVRQLTVVESTFGNVKAQFNSDLENLNTASVSDSTVVRAHDHLQVNEKTSEKFFQGPALRNTPDDDPAAPRDCDTSGSMKLSMAELFIG